MNAKLVSANHVDRFLRAAYNRGDYPDPIYHSMVDLIMGHAGLPVGYRYGNSTSEMINTVLRHGLFTPEWNRKRNYIVKLIWTDFGLRRIEWLLEQGQSRVALHDYLYTSLVTWAYKPASTKTYVSPTEFELTDDCWFAGTRIPRNVVDLAVSYLAEEGLLEHDPHERAGQLAVRTTSKGIRFLHSTQTVRDFVAAGSQPPPRDSVTNHFSGIYVGGSVDHANLASGNQNSQSINQGVSSDALASLVSQLRQVAPALGLHATEAEDLAEEVDALEREGTEPSRGRRIWRSIMRILTPAVTTVITADVEHAVNAAIEAGTDLFS
ncbi:hypothetical protein OG601_47990 [Streptomyces sp. NBC_01239]|uniref:hypothetical protein n=1 Tax=Streptomyces sp. NBC_01239 TaxID=2903792 RepID=UPI00224CE0DE|nr:hypothetical protein [Streptomyces sp. NBC_01239]MCX4818315.1 hypothetical protein [Streptomyces sp. NBC_01239]